MVAALVFWRVFIAATFTATVNYSRDYLLEFPATAFVTLGMYALLRSEAFRHRPWCLAFGALAGLSVLTKTMTGVFFIGPVLLALASLVWQQQLNAAVLRNFLLAVGMGMLVAAVWWGPNFRTAFGYLIYYGFQAGSVPYSKGDSGDLEPGEPELLCAPSHESWALFPVCSAVCGPHDFRGNKGAPWR